MITTWELTRNSAGDLDEMFVAYARRIVLEPGRPGRWELAIDLAEGGRLTICFRSAHGILGTFEAEEIRPRCPWLGPMATPLMPSTTAHHRVQSSRGGRLARLDATDPNFLHVERLQDEVFWMSMSMPSGELLVSRLISAAKITGEPRHKPGLGRPLPARGKRLPRRPQARALAVRQQAFAAAE